MGWMRIRKGCVETTMYKKYVNNSVKPDGAACRAGASDQANKARIGEHLASFFEAVGRIPSLQFQPVSAMSLDDMANEAFGLSHWSDVLGDLYTERTQARIGELHAEMERREAPKPITQEDGSQFTLTAQDIDAYLATRQDDEPVGIPCDSARCLLAEAFKWKYPKVTCIIVEKDGISIVEKTVTGIPLDNETREVMAIFDDTDHTSWGIPTTKREWLDAKARAEVYRETFGEVVIR